MSECRENPGGLPNKGTAEVPNPSLEGVGPMGRPTIGLLMGRGQSPSGDPIGNAPGIPEVFKEIKPLE